MSSRRWVLNFIKAFKLASRAANAAAPDEANRR
jgi:hypothetical protein